MPFITSEKRQEIDKDFRNAVDKGDACYLIYKEFVNEWNSNPCWTTVHNIYKNKIVDTLWLYKFKGNDKYTWNDWITALHLAWQVFFIWKVASYEEMKEEVNGEIE